MKFKPQTFHFSMHNTKLPKKKKKNNKRNAYLYFPSSLFGCCKHLYKWGVRKRNNNFWQNSVIKNHTQAAPLHTHLEWTLVTSCQTLLSEFRSQNFAILLFDNFFLSFLFLHQRNEQTPITFSHSVFLSHIPSYHTLFNCYNLFISS